MLGLLFSIIGIGLAIGIITSPIVALLVILKGKKEFSCLSCGMLSRRYPPLSIGFGFRLRCTYCGQRTLIPSNLPSAQQAMGKSVTPPVTHMPICTKCGFNNGEGARFCGHCGAPVSTVAIPNPPVWTGAPPPPVFPKPGISRAVWRFIAWGSAIAAGISILLVITGTLLPSAPNHSDASQPSATQHPSPAQEAQNPAPTKNDPAQTPEETEKDEQVKLGADAMLATWRMMPLAFNEQENLRFDAVVVMPNNTVCLWVHDANPVPGVIYPTALFYYPRSKTLLSLSDVTFDLWMRECKKQEGVGVEPDIEADFNQIREKTYGLNQALHDAQQ